MDAVLVFLTGIVLAVSVNWISCVVSEKRRVARCLKAIEDELKYLAFILNQNANVCEELIILAMQRRPPSGLPLDLHTVIFDTFYPDVADTLTDGKRNTMRFIYAKTKEAQRLGEELAALVKSASPEGQPPVPSTFFNAAQVLVLGEVTFLTSGEAKSLIDHYFGQKDFDVLNPGGELNGIRDFWLACLGKAKSSSPQEDSRDLPDK